MSRRVQLALDASAGPATVALFIDDALVGAERLERKGSAEMLAPTVAALLGAAGVRGADLTDVIVGGGPGSFTGVRVAAALAKGLARGAGAAMHSVPSLPLIAAAKVDVPVGVSYCVLDALRGEWFMQQVTQHADGRWTVDGPVERLPAREIEARAVARGAHLCGPPVHANDLPDARAALRIGVHAVDRDAWEPDYGRLAEAQVVWEAAHARPLPAS